MLKYMKVGCNRSTERGTGTYHVVSAVIKNVAPRWVSYFYFSGLQPWFCFNMATSAHAQNFNVFDADTV